MKLGDRGEEVVKVQRLLNQHGFSVDEDGIFGKKTEKAMSLFLQSQKDTIKTGNNEQVDSRTAKNLKTLDPKAQKIFLPFILEAKEIAKSMGFDYIAISGNRTPAEQQKLYNQGRTTAGPVVTNSKPYQSNHQYGIALDFGVFRDGKYLDDINSGIAEKVHLAVAKIANKYGIDAGAFWKKFKDQPHFEVSTGLTLAEKKSLLIKNGSVL